MILPTLKDFNLRIIDKIDNNQEKIEELIVDVKKIDKDNCLQQTRINSLLADMQKSIIYNDNVSLLERIECSIMYKKSGFIGETNKYIENEIKKGNEGFSSFVEKMINEKGG
jgi:hypothetical protein